MKSLSQTKFLSENYSALHGLNAVPLGLGLFLTSLWANIVHYPIRDFSLPIVFLLGSLLLSMAVNRYYQHTYGVLRPVLARRRLFWVTQCLWSLLGVVAFWVDVSFHLPVNFIGLLFAAMFLFDKPKVALPLNKFSVMRLMASTCIVLVSVAPVFLGKNWGDILGVRATIIGVTMFVGALIVL